jgi:hypothetical protein
VRLGALIAFSSLTPLHHRRFGGSTNSSLPGATLLGAAILEYNRIGLKIHSPILCAAGIACDLYWREWTPDTWTCAQH